MGTSEWWKIAKPDWTPSRSNHWSGYIHVIAKSGACMGYKPEVNVKNKFIIRCLTIRFPFLFLIFWSPLTHIWKKNLRLLILFIQNRENQLMVNLIFKHSFHQQMTLSVLVNWYHSAVHSSWIIFSITLSWVLHYIYVHQADIFNAPCHEDLGNKFILMTTCCVLIC